MHECFNTLITEMNKLGIEGCKQRRDELTAKLQNLFDENEVVEAIHKSGVKFPVDPNNVFGSLVDEAIRRAEAEVDGAK